MSKNNKYVAPLPYIPPAPRQIFTNNSKPPPHPLQSNKELAEYYAAKAAHLRGHNLVNTIQLSQRAVADHRPQVNADIIYQPHRQHYNNQTRRYNEQNKVVKTLKRKIRSTENEEEKQQLQKELHSALAARNSAARGIEEAFPEMNRTRSNAEKARSNAKIASSVTMSALNKLKDKPTWSLSQMYNRLGYANNIKNQKLTALGRITELKRERNKQIQEASNTDYDSNNMKRQAENGIRQFYDEQIKKVYHDTKYYGGSRKRSAHSKRKTHCRKTHRRKTHRR